MNLRNLKWLVFFRFGGSIGLGSSLTDVLLFRENKLSEKICWLCVCVCVCVFLNQLVATSHTRAGVRLCRDSSCFSYLISFHPFLSHFPTPSESVTSSAFILFLLSFESSAGTLSSLCVLLQSNSSSFSPSPSSFLLLLQNQPLPHTMAETFLL